MSLDNHLRKVPAAFKHSKELQTAVQDDKRRQEIDSAKKRAAAQNADYESFAALVSMAHIKPLERKKGVPGESAKHIRSLPAWSFDACGSFSPLGGSPSTVNESSLSSKTGNSSINAKQEENSSVAMGRLNLGSKAKCMTVDSFKREWKRLGTKFEGKLAFLLALSPDEFPIIFKIELPPSILSDMVEILWWWKDSSAHGRANASVILTSSSNAEGVQTCKIGEVSVGKECPLQPNFNAYRAFQMLKSLCSCGRFSLSLKLAGERVSSLANKLIDGLAECIEKQEMPCQRVKFSDMEDAANVGYVTEADGLNGQAVCLDALKHLAKIYHGV